MVGYGAEVAGSIQKSWLTAELRRKAQSSLAVNNEYSKIFLNYRKKGKKRDESWPCFFNWISRLQLERRGMFFKTINATSTHDSATTILNSTLHTMLFCHTLKQDPLFLTNNKPKHQCKKTTNQPPKNLLFPPQNKNVRRQSQYCQYSKDMIHSWKHNR